ncbi:MAG TPA: SDR family oxidoreductase [Anaerolineaceae bacterium]
MDLKLKGKIALVTGSSSGLGFATARLLAQEGARVAMNGRSPEKLDTAAEKIQAETGAEVFTVRGDLSEHPVAAQTVQAVADHWGGLDILIANAGGPPPGRFESFSDEAWQEALELSFLSQVRLIRAALPYLRKSDSPAVLTVTSYSVKQPIPNLVLSNSVRLATIGLTKTLAFELGKENIRFNSILPGWTETARVITLMENRARTNGTTVEEEQQRQASESPLGRMGHPEEFAAAAVFLVSPAAAYINGVMLPVDGGIVRGTL